MSFVSNTAPGQASRTSALKSVRPGGNRCSSPIHEEEEVEQTIVEDQGFPAGSDNALHPAEAKVFPEGVDPFLLALFTEVRRDSHYPPDSPVPLLDSERRMRVGNTLTHSLCEEGVEFWKLELRFRARGELSNPSHDVIHDALVLESFENHSRLPSTRNDASVSLGQRS